MENSRHFKQIDISFVLPDLHEIVALASNVSEMNAEDLLAFSKIAANAGQFASRVIEHLCCRAQS